MKPTQRFYRNIRIENNEFRSFHRDLVRAECVDGLTIRNNRLMFTNSYPFPQNTGGELFEYRNCSAIDIGANPVAGEKEVLA